MSSMRDEDNKGAADILYAIKLDNTMCHDALRQNNYSAVKSILDRQKKEIHKLSELLIGS